MVRQKVLILLSGKFLEWSQCTHRWWLLWHLSGTMMISPTMIFVVKFWIVVTIGCWLTSFTTSLVLPTIAVHYIRTIPTLYFLDSYVPQHYKPQRSPGPSKPRWPVWLQISLNIILYIILIFSSHFIILPYYWLLPTISWIWFFTLSSELPEKLHWYHI